MGLFFVYSRIKMTQQAQPKSSFSQPVSPKLMNKIDVGGMSKETDKLMRKWLKLQISQMYIGMVLKFLMFLLVGGSVVASVVTLGPIVEKQISALGGMMSMFQMAPTTPSSLIGSRPAQDTKDKNSDGKPSDTADIPGIMQELSPEERAEIMEIIENHE